MIWTASCVSRLVHGLRKRGANKRVSLGGWARGDGNQKAAAWCSLLGGVSRSGRAKLLAGAEHERRVELAVHGNDRGAVSDDPPGCQRRIAGRREREDCQHGRRTRCVASRSSRGRSSTRGRTVVPLQRPPRHPLMARAPCHARARRPRARRGAAHDLPKYYSHAVFDLGRC